MALTAPRGALAFTECLLSSELCFKCCVRVDNSHSHRMRVALLRGRKEPSRSQSASASGAVVSSRPGVAQAVRLGSPRPAQGALLLDSGSTGFVASWFCAPSAILCDPLHPNPRTATTCLSRYWGSLGAWAPPMPISASSSSDVASHSFCCPLRWCHSPPVPVTDLLTLSSLKPLGPLHPSPPPRVSPTRLRRAISQFFHTHHPSHTQQC